MNLENVKIYKNAGEGRGMQYFAKLDSFESAIVMLINPKRIWLTSQLKAQHSLEEITWLDFLTATGFSKEDVIGEIKRLKAGSCLR